MSGAAAPSPGRKPRDWIACADDFAIDEGAVDGILQLIERGRITATSALVDSPLWPRAAERLRAQVHGTPGKTAACADVGLHLNLTQALATSTAAVWPLGELVVRCAIGTMPRSLLQAAIEHQLDAFEDAMGQRPDYIDGHQHVHQFAVVREALVRALRRRYGSDLPWLRSTRAPAAVHDLKARLIAALGDQGLRKLACASHLHTNAYLVGVYNFRADAAAYWRRLVQWVCDGPQATVLMTHPAVRASPDDALAAVRPMEFAALASADFGALLAKAGITLTTGSRLFVRTNVASSGATEAAADG